MFVIMVVTWGFFMFAVNKTMSRRFLYKAIVEAVALIGCSVIQVALLQRLFERKLGHSRV
jgi:hypothetical protein